MPVSQISAGSADSDGQSSLPQKVMLLVPRKPRYPTPDNFFLQVLISVGLKSFVFVSADCAGVSASVFISAEFTRLNLAGVRVEDDWHSIRNNRG